MRESKFADETEVRVSQLITPEWANLFGNAHGGAVLKQADEIAYVCSARYSGTECVTAAVDRVDFHEPIHVGELVTFVARIGYVGRTSMEVEINIYAEDIPTGDVRHAVTCVITTVAMTAGKPTPVPRLICRTREDKARYIQAKMRRQMGIQYREERDCFLSQYAAMKDDELDSLLAGE